MSVKLPPLPDRIQRLPQDSRGFPVPWFVAWYDGKPDFRVTDADKKWRAITARLCWVCGEPLGPEMCFVVTPVCAVYRDAPEPPCHRECGVFAACACPFLTKPRMRRWGQGLPEESVPAVGDVDMKPGAAMLWITHDYRTREVDDDIVFEMGEPVEVMWFAEGRKATRAEVWESIRDQLSVLIEPAKKRGPQAVQDLRRRFVESLDLLPQM
jgi:hypothetical protein